MLEIKTLDDIKALSENYEVECKLAGGKDGKGALPNDFWSTYSAFANSYGGDIILGLKETRTGFKLGGIENSDQVISDLWNTVNNTQKVSATVLEQQHVRKIDIEGTTLIQVHVVQAQRKDKPIYLNNNPMTGTYKRRNSGDYKCNNETVGRMLAEQVNDSRDDELLKGYGLEDLDVTSFNAYRQLYVNLMPDHPWNQLDIQPFLRNIGVLRKNRETGISELTRAGLLMFGQLPFIQEVFPNYMLDYQERPEAKTEARWVDRITLDGSWSGNLYDFYRKIIKKLTGELKVPFKLEGGQRKDDTLVHQALREALVNTLVHADYTDRASVLIVKRPDMFGFRNPGLMRVPHELAVQGGDSDCRNRLLHQMFRYIGLGEQAGSGIPKIFQGWSSQHWRSPVLYEKEAPFEQTLLELRMLDLFPEKIVSNLRAEIGESFDSLSELERLILASAATEQVVTHRRMTEISTEHAHDLTLAFQKLVKADLLHSSGRGKGTVYHLPGQDLPSADLTFGEMPLMSKANTGYMEKSSGHNEESSGHNDENSGHKERNEEGCLIVKDLHKPLIDDLDELSADIYSMLISQAGTAREKQRLPKEVMEDIILQICTPFYLTHHVLAQLLKRKPDALRKNSLKPLIQDGKLTLAFPGTPTHPHQAYTSADKSEVEESL